MIFRGDDRFSVRERSTVFDGRLLDDGGGGAVVGIAAGGLGVCRICATLTAGNEAKDRGVSEPDEGLLHTAERSEFSLHFFPLPPDTLDNARRQWVAATGTAAEAIAIAGQDLKGARKPMN